MPSAGAMPYREGLPGLRRSGAVTELLFLYECATGAPTQLRPVAERLGVTVQAVSHLFRLLKQRGLIEMRDGHYRPTVEGLAWLHETLAELGADLRTRIERLHVIRSTRAVATATLGAGAAVSLELRDGVLSARPGGDGPSHGTVVRGGHRGALVEVGALEGIVPLVAATVSVRTVSERDLDDPALAARVAAAILEHPGLVAAEGLEAYHALRGATDRPVLRFAVAATCREASRLGVPSIVLVSDAELPRLVAAFGPADSPPLEVLPLGPERRARGPRRRRR